MENILTFFSNTFGNFVWLAVFFVAMLPIAEAKVAIPFAMNADFWGSQALGPWGAGFWAFLGSTLPAIFILLFLKPVFKALKKTKFFKKIVEFFEKYFRKKASKNKEIVEASDKKKTLRQSLKLMLFCAIPLPLAGVWTSSAVAVFSEVKFLPAFISICIGNLLEVIFMVIISMFFIHSLTILLIATLILLVVFVVISFAMKQG